MQNPDQQKRLLIAIVLSTVLMIVWMEFIAPKPQQALAPADAGAVAAAAADAGAPGQAAAASPDAGSPAAEAPPAAPIPERTVSFTSPTQDLVFTNRGGALSQAVVKDGERWPERKFVARVKEAQVERGLGDKILGFFKAAPAKTVPVDLARPRAGLALPGATEIKGELALPFSATYEVEESKDAVTFRTRTPDLELEKRYLVNPNGYELRMQVSVTNRTGAPKKASLGTVWPAWVDPKTEETGSFFSPPPELSQVMCRYAGSTEMLAGTGEPKQSTYAGPVRFAGFDERYFLGAFYPRFTEPTSCTLSSQPDGSRSALLEADLGTLAPGQTVQREFGVYIGPKANEELKRVSAANALGAGLTALGEEPKPGPGPKIDPELPEAIDLGWWAVIARVLLEVMKLFQKVVVNWGIAIVLLTVLVKLILYPLSHKQMASMESMRKIQPQIEALRKKYEGDREKLNMEQMRLFQENKVNPFGGCLPLIIQMPVWIALYRTLLASFELYREPLIGFWISDLTAHDPFFILPLAMGVTMFITQKMQPTMGDPTQAKMMLYFMPVLFTAMMFFLPAGLTLYIFTNNLLSIAQQKWLQRKFAKAEQAKK